MLLDVLSTVEKALGHRGHFTPTDHGATIQVVWHGRRHHRYGAERALVAALTAAGFEAESIPGWGVRVIVADDVRPFGDHEAATLNGEPDSSTVRECQLTDQAAE